MAFMILNVFTQALTIGLAILLVFAVSYVIDIMIVRIHKKAVFLLPSFFFLAGTILWILGLLASDDGSWAAFGLLLYGSFAAILFVGSLIAGLVVWYTSKPKS